MKDEDKIISKSIIKNTVQKLKFYLDFNVTQEIKGSRQESGRESERGKNTLFFLSF